MNITWFQLYEVSKIVKYLELKNKKEVDRGLKEGQTGIF